MFNVHLFFLFLLIRLKFIWILCLYLKMCESLDSLFDMKLAPIRSFLQDITNSGNFLSERLDAMEKKVKDLETAKDLIPKENQHLRLETIRLSQIVEEMKVNLNEMEQYSRRDCCEITGIPKTPDEDTNDLVIKVGALMDIDLEEDDISISRRLAVPSCIVIKI